MVFRMLALDILEANNVFARRRIINERYRYREARTF